MDFSPFKTDTQKLHLSGLQISRGQGIALRTPNHFPIIHWGKRPLSIVGIIFFYPAVPCKTYVEWYMSRPAGNNTLRTKKIVSFILHKNTYLKTSAGIRNPWQKSDVMC